MFACSACARRASNAILHRVPATTKSPSSTPIPSSSSRAIWTGSRPSPNDHDGPSARDNGFRRQEVDSGLPGRNNNRSKHKPPPTKIQRAVRAELKWIGDPWHLAVNVTKKLRGGEFEKALALVREASNGSQVVVSWNHLIEYLFKQQRLQAAIKLFNEVSSRLPPPSHTLSIRDAHPPPLLRGARR